MRVHGKPSAVFLLLNLGYDISLRMQGKLFSQCLQYYLTIYPCVCRENLLAYNALADVTTIYPCIRRENFLNCQLLILNLPIYPCVCRENTPKNGAFLLQKCYLGKFLQKPHSKNGHFSFLLLFTPYNCCP